jgi:hypothetical protein
MLTPKFSFKSEAAWLVIISIAVPLLGLAILIISRLI